MKTIILKPLAERPLSSQFFDLTGDHYWHDTFERSGNVYTHIKTGRLFETCSAELEAAFKAKKAEADRQEAEAKKHKYDHLKTPFIDYNNPERWRAGLKHCLEGNITEMCEESFWNFLEAVPPTRMKGNSYMCGEPHHHNSAGQEVSICGIERGEKYYAQYGTAQQYDNRELFKNI